MEQEERQKEASGKLEVRDGWMVVWTRMGGAGTDTIEMHFRDRSDRVSGGGWEMAGKGRNRG